jgi:hypothetical protein
LNLTYLPGNIAETFTINEKALEKKGDDQKDDDKFNKMV